MTQRLMSYSNLLISPSIFEIQDKNCENITFYKECLGGDEDIPSGQVNSPRTEQRTPMMDKIENEAALEHRPFG